ncbi:MAG: VirB4 family type IV secretion/conjugal transfer ATPase, partial [Pseudomonadota bacterium]
ETGNDEDLDIKKTLRNNLLKSLNGEKIYLHFYILNSKITNTNENYYEHNSFAAYLNNKWHKKQSNGNQYQKEIYIAVKYHFEKSDNIIDRINDILSNSNIYKQIQETSKSLKEIMKRLINSLRDYDPKTLKIVKKNETYYCAMLEFLAKINNLKQNTKIILPKTNINKHICQSRITFKKDYMIHKNTKEKYSSILALNSHSSSTSSSILDNLLYLNFEFILHQTFSFTNKNNILHKMEIHQNQMIQTKDKSISQIYEISDALDMATSGKIAFGYHSLQLICSANNLKALEEYTSIAFTEMINSGLTPVREQINMEMSYFSLFPGNEEYIMRKTLINTLNLAGYASLHNFPVGEKYNNHWGSYTSLLETTADSPYYFNFHAKGSDVGHTLIIGPTGAGKTVIMNFLATQLQKFKPKMFFFDKDHGAEIFIRSINGIYNTIQTASDCGFNPLQLQENEINKAFLFEWLSALVTSNNEVLSAKDRQLIYQAIEGNYKLQKTDRQLKNIAPFLGIPLNNNIASRLQIWYGTGAKANIFDNAKDTIDFTISKIFGFEMSNVLRDKVALSPILLYIFHKIQISLNGYPT